ncbi:hypothetical protein SDC9_196058 [bioreactor metagenome]|uniref:Uncharacterized protein n=1 Tax=bioreactor metagenome TaxID=1076179 RepID=A0A645IAT1_9ZZZZ
MRNKPYWNIYFRWPQWSLSILANVRKPSSFHATIRCGRSISHSHRKPSSGNRYRNYLLPAFHCCAVGRPNRTNHAEGSFSHTSLWKNSANLSAWYKHFYRRKSNPAGHRDKLSVHVGKKIWQQSGYLSLEKCRCFSFLKVEIQFAASPPEKAFLILFR